MLTRRCIGLILIITSIFLSIVGFLMIDWKHIYNIYYSEYYPREYFLNKKSFSNFLFTEAIRLYINTHKHWLLLCLFLAFIGILLIITSKKPKPSNLEEKKSNLEKEK